MRKAERRQKILNHARDVFARRGYHEARIEDIVAAAAIARGTFYLYFKDKRTIFEEIVDRAFTQMGMAIVRVDPRDPGRSVADQVHENIRRMREDASRRSVDDENSAYRCGGPGPDVRPQVGVVLRGGREPLGGKLARGTRISEWSRPGTRECSLI